MRKILFLFISALVMVSCQWGGKSSHGSDEIQVKIARYDRLQYEYVTLHSVAALQKMNTNYPQVTKLMIEDVLELGKVDDNKINEVLLDFFRDTTLQRLVRDVDVKFKDLSWLEEDLEEGMKKFKKKVPSLRTPWFYSQISALNQSVVVVDTVVGFSLDKYMGADYDLYKRYYYDYQTYSMRPNRIVPDCFTYYLLSEYPYVWKPGRTLLELMMHRGKVHWVVSQVLGYKSFADEMGYTEKEGKWCRENKESLWKEILEKGHLDATNHMLVSSYLQKEPYISIVDGRSPSRIGVWLGMHLVDDYMKLHPEISFTELLEMTDYRKMFDEVGPKI